jgi:hypothetical protein
MIAYHATLYCDRCGKKGPIEGTSATSVRRQLHPEGWRRQGGKDKCPDCAGRPGMVPSAIRDAPSFESLLRQAS